MATSSSMGPRRGPNASPSQPTPTPAAHAGDPAGTARAASPVRAVARRPGPGADLLEPLASKPLDTAFAGHEAGIDPILRGTRPSNGATVTAAELGRTQHGPVQANVTTFGTTLKVEDAHGQGGSLAIDRQSALVGGAAALADGEKVSASAGAIGPLGYASATYNDGHGTAVGGFVMATTGGTPGFGANFSHTGALGGIAASPSMLVDKVGTASVQGIVDGRALVEQKSSRMVLGNLPISVGHAGFAVSARVLADAREEQTYTYQAELSQAREKAPKDNWITRRIEGFRRKKKLDAMPALADVAGYVPGAKRTTEVEHSHALSMSASAAGVQLVAGRAASRKTAASVTVPAAQAEKEAEHVSVSLTETTSAGRLLGTDLPALLAVHVGTQRAVEKDVTYKFAHDDAEGIESALKRTAQLGVEGHFVMPEQFEAADVAKSASAAHKWAELHGQNDAVESIRLAAGRGGLSWRVNVLSLPSSLLGPRFGLSYGQDRGRKVHYASASEQLSLVATGRQERTQRELPYVGGSSRQLELLAIDAQLSTGDGEDRNTLAVRHDVVRYKETHTHARQATLLDAQSLLSRAVPSQLGQSATSTAPRPPVAMDLELEMQLVVTADAVRKLARPGGLLVALGTPPSAASPLSTQQAFQQRGVAMLGEMLRGASRKKVTRIMAALDQARADVTVNVTTNLFNTVEKAAAEVQVQAAALRRGSSANASTRLFREILPGAATVADQLQGAWDVLHSEPFRQNAPNLFAQQKSALRKSRDNLSALFAEQIAADQGVETLSVSPRTQSLLDRVAKDRGMRSPKLDEAELRRNPMDALYAGGDELSRF